MLIPSHRHTPADLELWREYEEADLVHGERLLQSGRVEQSVEAIREFATRAPCYCSVSWGKDSTVLADLVLASGCEMPMVRFRSDEDKYPHDDDVRDAFLPRWPWPYREFVVTWPQRGATDWKMRNALAARELGTQAWLMGLRAEESRGRRISMLKLGLDTGRTCRPLAWWKVRDVFGYLAVRGLPVHPNYGMLGGGRWEREHLRVSGLGGDPGGAHGRREWEREYYGDVLARLAQAGRRDDVH